MNKWRRFLDRYMRYLPMYGCVATGCIYLGIGVIALLSFLKLKDGGADESSLLAFLNEYIVGKIFVWIIMLGTVSYIVWRIYEAFADPYDYGSSMAGKAKRLGIFLSTISDIVIVYSAVTILLGASNVQLDGQPEAERELVNRMLARPQGSWMVVTIGAIILVTAFVQLFYGVSRGYKERVDVSRLNHYVKYFIHVTAWIGYTARAAILGIIGFFFIKAGKTQDSEHIVNTDKAFDFIGDEMGHAFFIAVAAGTICYAVFMFSLGISYNAVKDEGDSRA